MTQRTSKGQQAGGAAGQPGGAGPEGPSAEAQRIAALEEQNRQLTAANAELRHRLQEHGSESGQHTPDDDGSSDREQPFRAIVESVRDYAIMIVDQEGRIQEWLPGAAAVFGWSADEVIGQSPEIIYTPEDRAAGVWPAEFAHASAEGFASDRRWHLRKDGQRVYIDGSAHRLRDAGGALRGIIKIGQDITERRRAEEALRESEAKTKLLMAELQHRVRNTLAVVRSIARRTARTSRTVEDYTAHLDGRLDAFTRVQAAVMRNPAAGVDLEQLFAGELLAHAAHEGQQIVRIGGPKLRLQPKAAETVALAIHELATNAVKYGALSVPTGRIAVAWHIDNAEPVPQLEITWSESGMTLSGEPPATQGFGTELIRRTLAYELSAEADLSFLAGGLRCTIRLPLTERLLLSRDRLDSDAPAAREP